MGNLTNIIVVMTTINIICVMFSAILGVATLGDLVVYQLFERNSIVGSNPKINSGIDNGFVKQVSQQESGGFTNNFFQIVDGLRKVFYVVVNLIGLGFGVFVMLYATGTPIYITMLIGLPVGIAYYLSIVGVIRGMDI
jgi:uncharacterized protein (DUF983 family)